MIYGFFTSVDRLAFWAASRATAWFFPGDRVYRGVGIAVFFDTALVAATGLQGGFLGLCVGLFLGRSRGEGERRNRETLPDDLPHVSTKLSTESLESSQRLIHGARTDLRISPFVSGVA